MRIPGQLRLVLVAFATTLAGFAAAADRAVPAVDQPAPEIAGKGVNGRELKLSDHKGKVVLVDFWGDW